MKDILLYYKGRFQRIFTYTSKKWYYVIAKTLCVAVGLPLYVALLPLDIVNFLLYALFSFIPVLNVFFLFICRVLSIICGAGHYIGILPDAKMYIERHKEELKQEFLQNQREEYHKGTQEVSVDRISDEEMSADDLGVQDLDALHTAEDNSAAEGQEEDNK